MKYESLCLIAWQVYSLSLDRKRARGAQRAALRTAATRASASATDDVPPAARGIDHGLTFARVDGDAGRPGSAITGTHGAGLAASTRYWVHVNDQPGNCWDSPP